MLYTYHINIVTAFLIVGSVKKKNTTKQHRLDESDMNRNGNNKSALYRLSLRLQALC